jgi:uncharacterized membrane protein
MIIPPRHSGFLKKNRDRTDRPVVRTEITPTDWLLELLAIAGLLTMFGFTIYQFQHLPATIPSHFNAAGQVDDYASRGTVWTLPGLSVFIYVLLTMILLVPHQFNYMVKITPQNAVRQYTLALRFIRYLKAIIIWLFFFITREIVAGALGKSTGLGFWFMPVFLGMIFIPMIFYFIASSRHK